jgi:hypothetical protein
VTPIGATALEMTVRSSDAYALVSSQTTEYWPLIVGAVNAAA